MSKKKYKINSSNLNHSEFYQEIFCSVSQNNKETSLVDRLLVNGDVQYVVLKENDLRENEV